MQGRARRVCARDNRAKAKCAKANCAKANGARTVAAGALVFVALALGACAGPSTPRPGDRAADVARAAQLADRAQQHQIEGDLDKSIELYEQALLAAPDLGAAWNNLGLALMARGKTTDRISAQQAFIRAANLLPSDPSPYRNLGLLYEQRNLKEDALRYYEQALVIDEYDVNALRGSIKMGKDLRRSDQAALDRLVRAQMIETDPKWLEMIQRERLRVKNDMEER
jgi:tetratricopeptide (TPR) repeat protein